MKLLLIFLFFCSCNKIIYVKHNSDGSYEQLSFLWKKSGEYRAAIINYNSKKDHWFSFTIHKGVCDSLFFLEFIRVNNKKTDNIKEYLISRTGNIKAEFSHIELKLLAEMKKAIDSLGWCPSGILLIPDSLYLTEVEQKKKPSR